MKVTYWDGGEKRKLELPPETYLRIRQELSRVEEAEALEAIASGYPDIYEELLRFLRSEFATRAHPHSGAFVDDDTLCEYDAQL